MPLARPGNVVPNAPCSGRYLHYGCPVLCFYMRLDCHGTPRRAMHYDGCGAWADDTTAPALLPANARGVCPTFFFRP